MEMPTYIPIDDRILKSSLSCDEKMVLVAINSCLNGAGCKRRDTELATIAGLKIGKFKKNLKGLVESGWVVIDDAGKTRVLTLSLKEQAKEVKKRSKDIFDADNLQIDEKTVNHLINIFIKSGLNPKVTEEIAKRYFANPWVRVGAKKLIAKYGATKVEDVINGLIPRKDEMYCPKIKSLYSLVEKWESVQYFLNTKSAERDKIAVIK